MVNGAFATVTSLHHTIKYLRENFNVFAFDLPFAGKSQELNDPGLILDKEEEVHIILDIIEKLQPEYAISMSWGGVSLLLALAQRPQCIRRAVLGSFAPSLNGAMREYLQQALKLLASNNLEDNAKLFNNSLGMHLPRLFKAFNAQYLKQFAATSRGQIEHHLNHILALDAKSYQNVISGIEVPLLFINGELDRYTTVESIRAMKLLSATMRSACISGAGHFLDMEGRSQWREMRTLITEYLLEDFEATLEHS